MNLHKFPFPDHQTRKQRYGMNHTLSFPVYHVLRGEFKSKTPQKSPLGKENLELHSRYLTENLSRRFSRKCPLSSGAGIREKNLRRASGRNMSV